MEAMRLYIAGPITGRPPSETMREFNAAARRLRSAGLEPTNPVHSGIDATGGSWADYMRKDLVQLLSCDGIATLPGWWRSRGAALEVYVGTHLTMPVRSVAEWCEKARAERKASLDDGDIETTPPPPVEMDPWTVLDGARNPYAEGP